jgi:hypothetical protein
MATDNQSMLAGLFMTPEMYQQQQLQNARANALKFAELSPEAKASYGLNLGIERAAQGLGGLMGIEDPQMKIIAARNQVMKNIDYNDPESVKSSIQALMSVGDTQGAHELYQETLKNSLTQSQITKNTKERAVSGLPDIAKLQAYRDQLVQQFGENDPRVKQVDAAIAKSTHQGKSLEESLGAGLGAIANAMAGITAKKAAESSGTDVGKKIADIEGPQSALDAIKGAKDIFKKGIFAGKYGPTMENLAGYSEGVVGSKERLANTEQFRAYLGDVVIPGLKDFGGSDTVEELKYLQSVYAGDTTAQPKALEAMLNRAENKIMAKIKRIQDQQKSIETGKPLPTGPSMTANIRTWNPTTRKFE